MKRVIIIGNASYNTLSAIRSFGEGQIPIVLIMVDEHDPLFIRKSRYLNKRNLYIVDSLDKCEEILNTLKSDGEDQMLMTIFDTAAEWVDEREPELSKFFCTPCRGKQIGKLFHKDEQCKLAEECGLTVPKSVVYHRGDTLPIGIEYPILTKPLVSSLGRKWDIHICNDENELNNALQEDSLCDDFIIQEYMEKDFEINCIGVKTENETNLFLLRKIRQWPSKTGLSSFVYLDRIEKYNINKKCIESFLNKVGYNGLFSVEFIHKNGINYFLEVNFRNDLMTYSVTAGGVNPHVVYFAGGTNIDMNKLHQVYVMNTSNDLLHVKSRSLSWKQWFSDFFKTSTFINFNKRDLMPTFWYYLRKILLILKIERYFHFY